MHIDYYSNDDIIWCKTPSIARDADWLNHLRDKSIAIENAVSIELGKYTNITSSIKTPFFWPT